MFALVPSTLCTIPVPASTVEAAKRGHRVVLFEKQKELGGLIRISDFDKGKIDVLNYKKHLIYQVTHSNITLKLGTEATPESVREINPDVVIVAIGSEPIKPRVSGIADDTRIIGDCAAPRRINEASHEGFFAGLTL
jgi:NADPH-dependent 2,4-dienoyl-CoA reductase/sulfur reductase-like enzyme